MAASTTITLHSLSEEVASGAGAAVDLGAYRSLRLYLDVTAIVGTLTVHIETSRTGVGEWRPLASFDAATSAAVIYKSAPGADRYARVRWVVATGPATFSVAGDKVQVLASITDLYEVGVREAALAAVFTDDQLDRYLERASDFVLGYLPASTPLPIISWGADLRRATAIVAAYDIMTAGLGVQPDVRETDNIFDHRYHDIREWLLLLSQGSAAAGVVVDTTLASTGGPSVSSDVPRGW